MLVDFSHYFHDARLVLKTLAVTTFVFNVGGLRPQTVRRKVLSSSELGPASARLASRARAIILEVISIASGRRVDLWGRLGSALRPLKSIVGFASNNKICS